MYDPSQKRDRIRRVSFNDDDEEIRHPEHELEDDDDDSNNSSPDSDTDNGSDSGEQSVVLVFNSPPPPRGILKKTSSEERQDVVVAMEIQENSDVAKLPEGPKKKRFVCPGLFILDIIDRHWMSPEHKFKTEDDFKMTILFCKISSIWFMNILGAASAAFLILMVVINMHERVVLHNILPWLFVTIMNLSVLSALWLKLPRLLNPFRLCCVIFQATCLITALISFGFLHVGSVLVFLQPYLSEIFDCSDPVSAEKFRAASLIMVASGFFYFVAAVIGNATNKAYFYMIMKERIHLAIDSS